MRPSWTADSDDASACRLIHLAHNLDSTLALMRKRQRSNELAIMLADLVSFKLQPIYVKDRPQEVKNATCSADKARRLLAYQTKVSLRDGLISMIEWIRAHGPKPFEYHLPIEIDSPLVPATWRDRLL
jgi:UDP-glucose 4-epimerase